MHEKAEKEQIIKTLTSENLKIGSELSESEQSARLCSILEKEIDYLNQQVESKDKQMHLTQVQLKTSQEALDDTSKKLDEIASQFQEQHKELKLFQSEAENIRDQLKTLEKMNLIYQPVKDDNVDKQIGSFLNSQPPSLRYKLCFIRENEGVYLFGKRKLFIKCEKENL